MLEYLINKITGLQLYSKAAHWQLICEKGVLRCFDLKIRGVVDIFVWDKEEHYWKRSHTDKYSYSVKNMSLFLRYWGLLNFNWENNLKAFFWNKFLVNIYLVFSWDTEVSFYGISLLYGKRWRSYISLANWQIAIYINLVNRDVLLNNWIS